MSKKLSQLSLEELKTSQKRYKSFVTILSVFTLITLLTLIYFSIKNENYNFLILSGGCAFALLLCSANLKQIEKEIKSRTLE